MNKMRSLRILITVDPEIPVPPRLYGGIERIVDMLARGLVARGHDVALLAHPDSTTAGHLIPYKGRHSKSRSETLLHMGQLHQAVRVYRPDLVHSFGRLAYLLPVLSSSLPKVQSYQREVTSRSVRWGHRLSRGSLAFTACSISCARGGQRGGGRWSVVPNGVPANLYTFSPSVPPDAPLVFLGRIERIKGAHTAIEVAQRAGRRIIIAGNVVRDGGEAEQYFEEEIAPQLDGDQVVYVGPVDDAQKNVLLGGAAAFLMPIDWEEPFGIVMAEALACGTPVLAFPRGAAPEIVENGVNGFLCTDADAMVQAISRVLTLDRSVVRRSFEEHFSDDVIVAKYENLYREMV